MSALFSDPPVRWNSTLVTPTLAGAEAPRITVTCLPGTIGGNSNDGSRRRVLDDDRDRRTGSLVAGRIVSDALQGVGAVGHGRAVPGHGPALGARGRRGDERIVQRSARELELDLGHTHGIGRAASRTTWDPDTQEPAEGTKTLVVTLLSMVIVTPGL